MKLRGDVELPGWKTCRRRGKRLAGKIDRHHPGAGSCGILLLEDGSIVMRVGNRTSQVEPVCVIMLCGFRTNGVMRVVQAHPMILVRRRIAMAVRQT